MRQCRIRSYLQTFRGHDPVWEVANDSLECHDEVSHVLFGDMVPVKGIDLFYLFYLSHLLFFIHIAFGKCKYCSLVFFIFILFYFF